MLAHELAHHSQEHLPKGLGWFAIFAVPGAWILMRATRSRGGMGVPEAVPVALIVVAVFQLATAPLSNHISRRMEAEADWKALQVTQDPAALQGVMQGFASTSLGDPDPPAWAEQLPRHAPVARRPRRRWRGAWKSVTRRTPPASNAYVTVYSGPEPPSGGVRRPPLAVIAPHWTQFDGVTSTATIPSPKSRPTSYTCAGHIHVHASATGRRTRVRDLDVVRLVVARAVPGREDGRELVEDVLAVRLRDSGARGRS